MSQLNSQQGMASLVDSAIRMEQKEKLATLLKHVSKLTDLEKLYLYLKLPTGPGFDEPVKRSTSLPLTSANRNAATLKWIRSHYVEDKNFCVLKQEIYNQYRLYCEATTANPVGSADFGKMVKTAFPNIHHRRLGQRGKSKYCYGGLKRKTQIEIPTLPLLESKPFESSVEVPDHLQEMQNLSSQLVCDWACRLFDKKFTDIKSLAQHLIETGAAYGKKASYFSMMYKNNGVPSRIQDPKSLEPKLQETQALLQSKLHQKEVLKEHANLLKQQQQQQKSQTEVLKIIPVNALVTVIGEQDVTSHSARLPPSNQRSVSVCFASDNHQGGELQAFATLDANAVSAEEENLVGGGITEIVVGNQDRCSMNDSVDMLPVNRETEGKPDNQTVLFNDGGTDSLSSRMSSHSTEDMVVEDQKQNDHKRMGDVPTDDRMGKRRRCTTSLGVPHQHLMEDHQQVGGDSSDSYVETRVRPFSCPTLRDILTLGPNSKYLLKSARSESASKKMQKFNRCRTKGNHKMKDVQRSFNSKDLGLKKSAKSPDKELNCSTKSDKSSFHFVQKPTVIAVRQPSSLFPSVMSCPNFTSCQNLDQDQDSSESISDVKKTHNILNTLLSSDTNSSLPKPHLLSPTSLPPYLTPSGKELNDIDVSMNKQTQKLPHTLDNAYLLPSQSSRSAFVPVARDKLQDLSQSRRSHPCLPTHSPLTCSSVETQKKEGRHSATLNHSGSLIANILFSVDGDIAKDKKLPMESFLRSSSHSLSSEACETSITNNGPLSLTSETRASDHFKPIACSTSSQTSVSASTVVSQPPVLPISIVSSSPISNRQTPTQVILPKQPVKLASKSPVTPPRRQSRSRFTPIRPKISAGTVPSPPKKDMRPVSTILKEQRVRNAQELLVNLASTCQGELKLHMPAELLGLTSPGKPGSSDVLVTIGASGIGPCSTVASDLPGFSPNKEFNTSTALEPKSQNTPPNISLSVPASNVVSKTFNCSPQLSSMNDTGKIPIDVIGSKFQTSPCRPSGTDTGESKLVIADDHGLIYTIEKDSQQFHLPHNMKSVVLQDEDSISPVNKNNSSIINISDIEGHIFGPDDAGQRYLIVPNSLSLPQAEVKAPIVNESHSAGQAGTSLVLPSPASFTGVKNQSSPLASQEGIHKMPMNLGVSSSSALLSELSQLASKQEKTQTLQMQTPIQHDSELSAFHKCSPNKQQTVVVDAASSLVANLDSLTGQSCATVPTETFALKDPNNERTCRPLHPLKQNQTCTQNTTGIQEQNNMTYSGKTLLISQQHQQQLQHGHSVRKRKASKSRDLSMKDKKRQNIHKGGEKCNEDDDVVILDVQEQNLKPGDSLKDVKQVEDFIGKEKAIDTKERSEIDLSDTEALLQMIDGSRSLTVKQTVMALNSLKAEMKQKLLDTATLASGTCIDPTVKSGLQGKQHGDATRLGSSEVNERVLGKNVLAPNTISSAFVPNENISHLSVADKQKLALKISRSSKRNMSLNLESLESDALLDNEPTLDHRLVGDVGERKLRKSDHKASAAVIVKTSKSRKQPAAQKKLSSLPSDCNIAATDRLKSYQPILKENKIRDTGISKRSMKFSDDFNSAHFQENGPPVLPRRSMSCVPDILERDSPSALAPLKQNETSNIERSSGVEYFDELLSKMQSKRDSAVGADSRSRPKSQADCDLDIPVDVVDFVTESMSSRSYRNNLPFARCVSVPNTKPDFYNLDNSTSLAQAQRLLMCSLGASNTTSRMSSGNSVAFQGQRHAGGLPNKGEEYVCDQSDELAANDKQNVFLSPVGPAKLARRLSIEKTVLQPPADRSRARTPVDFSPMRHGLESSVSKPSGIKSQSIDRQSTRALPLTDKVFSHPERKRAKTPFDPSLHNEKRSGKPRTASQSPDELVSMKAPVNRSLTRTPMDKFFQKMVSDSLLSKYQIESLNTRDQLSNQDEYLSRQTPSSDAGYGSVSETPVSDFGYNSVSPSPVMMSSSSFFGECGRRDITSPATIFMPLRSDSALSLNNSNLNQDHLNCPSQTNLSEILPQISNQLSENFEDMGQTQSMLTLGGSQLSSFLSQNSQEFRLHAQVPARRVGSENGCDYVNELTEDSLVSLNSIPTPPFSPNSSSTTTSMRQHPPQFNIPFSPLPNHDNSPSPPAIPRFLLPSSMSASSTVFSQNPQSFISSASPPRRLGPHDQQNASMFSYSQGLALSPVVMTRPPSSPHLFGSHPSPPFTPCSMPSPCPTPSSLKSLVSPRSLTPSADHSHAPNGFMPIQSSCIQTSSLAPSHTYIQPIKPVVTLASLSSQAVTSSGDEPQAHTASSGTLTSSMGGGALHKVNRHVHGRLTPSVLNSLMPSTNESQQLVSDNRLMNSLGISSSGHESVISLSKSSRINRPFSAQGSWVWSEKSPSAGIGRQGQFAKLPNQELVAGGIASSASGRSTCFKQLKSVDSENLVIPRDQSINLEKSTSGSSVNQFCDELIDRIESQNGQLIRHSGATVYQSPLTTESASPITFQAGFQQFSSNPQQTFLNPDSVSLFMSAPSKLQVDLTKLEASQDPTTTVQSTKPFVTGQCEKINLDSCDATASSLHINSPSGLGHTRQTSPPIMVRESPLPTDILFDTRKRAKDDTGSFNFADIANANHRPSSAINDTIDNNDMWNEGLSKPCQDDLQATLEVLRDIDSQYFPSDEDNSNGASSTIL